jgi:hypothetical protein
LPFSFIVARTLESKKSPLQYSAEAIFTLHGTFYRLSPIPNSFHDDLYPVFFWINSVELRCASVASAFRLAMTNTKNISQGQIFIEISSQAKITCGATTVFQAIYGNPHVMHKDHVVFTDILPLTRQVSVRRAFNNLKI